jgi:1-acyl-sn-glycerol-3-phosphate acyltransferase
MSAPSGGERVRGTVKRLYPLLNFIQLLYLIVWTVFWISLAILVSLFTLNREAALVMARRFWGPGLRWGAMARLEVDPLPGIDFTRPHVYVMNHQSMFDIPVAFITIPQNIRFVAKQILKYVPFLGWYMWMTGMVFVDRGHREKAIVSLKLAGERIRGGASILVYPEGTRSQDGSILPFKKGPFVVAIEAGVPIVPVAIEGTGKVLPRDGFRLRPGTVRVKLGEEITTTGLSQDDRDALMYRVRAALIDLHRQIGGAGGDKANAVAVAGQEGVGRGDPGVAA